MNECMKSIRNVLATILMIASLCISMVGCADIQATANSSNESSIKETTENATEQQILDEMEEPDESVTKETIPSKQDSVLDETIHTHSYTSKVTSPTCTAKGFTTYTCSVCGDSYTGNETNATGHNWDNWKVIREPTTTTEGAERRTCKNCSKADTRTTDKLPEETKPAYETFNGTIGSFNARNLAYTDWKGDTEQAAYIEIFTVEKSDDVLNALVAEFEKIYGFAPSLGDKYRCTSSCEEVGTYIIDGYSEPQTVYHFSLTDKTYIYATNPMYEVYVQEAADGSVWCGYAIYASMDTIGEERSKAEVQALDQEMYSTFEALIGLSQNEMGNYKDELELKIGYISEAGTVRSIHSEKPVQMLYVYCRGFVFGGADE